MDIERLAGHLDDARRHGREVERLTLQTPDLDLPRAYQVMEAGIALRVAAGERVIGMKMGLTSEAKRKQMSLDAPIYGVLTDAMVVQGSFHLRGSLHPKIEPEIAFRFARGLPANADRAAVLSACTGVGPALEILDSRYRDFKYFSLPDVVADNSSSSHVVLPGRWLEIDGRDLGKVELVMSVDGTPRQRATGSAISGDPALSMVQLSALLAGHGRTLEPGSVVLAGAATAAEQLAPGMEVRLDAGWLGSLSLRVAP